jgi:hypothetical protein
MYLTRSEPESLFVRSCLSNHSTRMGRIGAGLPFYYTPLENQEIDFLGQLVGPRRRVSQILSWSLPVKVATVELDMAWSRLRHRQ